MATATETKERPILFSGAMVNAIRDGRKSMTRRIVKPQPSIPGSGPTYPYQKLRNARIAAVLEKCPYGQPGDVLWVRETFQIGHETGESSRAYSVLCPTGSTDQDGMVFYRADNHPDVPSWRPSIHMPRRACRLTLELTEVRVERVQDITEADALAEGCVRPVIGCALDNFYRLWNEVNGEGAWEANPWVWTLSFKPS